MHLRVGRGGVVADFRNVHRVEQIVAAAVIAVHIDLAFFRQDAVHFFIRQRFQRARTAFTRTGTLELNVLRVVERDLFFMVQTPQHIVSRKGQQLFGFDGSGQRRQVIEVVCLRVLRGHYL